MSGTTNHKPFGLWTLTFLVIANMIGAGVFTTSGFALGALGSPKWVMMAWVCGGLIAVCGALSYGQLVRVRPESGGEYLFLSRLGHPLLGFVAGWVSLIAGFTGAIALAATALESYVLPQGVRPDWLPRDAIALLAVLLGGVCHGLQSRTGAVVQNTAVVLKLTFLAVLLGLAAYYLPTHSWHHQPLPDFTLSGWALAPVFAAQLVWISLSYSGFNAAVYVAGEVQSPAQTVPRALLLGTSVVFVLYVLLNAVFVYAPPADAIAGVEDVAAIAAGAFGGPTLAHFVRIIIAVGLWTSVTSMMMAAPRVYAKMAEDGMLPSFLRFRDAPPRAAVTVQVVLAAIMILASSLRELIPYLGLTLSLSAACSVGCLLLPNVRSRPLGHWSQLPIACYLAGTIIPAGLMSYHEPKQLLATALTFGIGALAYLAVRTNGARTTVR